MAKKPQTAGIEKVSDEPVNLGLILSRKPLFQSFRFWIIGDTPIITHAWSEKAKREMLQKQVKATKGGREARDPRDDFVSSLYEMGDGGFGFPATGIKNCILSAAHKDKGVARSAVMGALWIDAEMIRVRPALAGAVCDMPLVRIHGSDPEMREDMVKIGGMTKTANLAYRGQFRMWGMRVTGRLNASVVTPEQLAFLVQESGVSSGLGEWRNERKGMFGAFHMATAEEEKQWEDYAAGRGPLPVPESYKKAAE
jgi:hypothetical protein